MPSRPIVSVLCLLAGAAALAARDSGPVFWTTATAADFVKGRSEGVFVSLEGAVAPGPVLTNRMTSSPAQVWSVAAASDGTLWAGTGGDGRLVRLRPGQQEETVFDSTEANIFAVAVAGQRVFAASSPDGRVYVVDGAAAARPFFDPAEKYIWALDVDSAGRLWVAAGNPAAIYRVDPSGTGQVVYKPAADHVVAFARDANGRLLAGTESPGRLYRFDENDRPFALLDPAMTELRAIAPAADGAIYAAGVARGDASTSADQTTSVSITVAEPPEPGATPPAAPPKRSALFRIEPGGLWERVWDTEDLIYDIATTADGAVLAATGPAGRLYRVERTREVLLYSGVDAKQITRFAPAAAGAAPAAFATANPGRVVSIGAGVQSPASYLSPVRDTSTVATWGLLRWDATGDVRLFTRSGNTAEPDDSWSPWSVAYTRREGTPVSSPAARYLQWKAEFTTAAGAAGPPRLEAVTVAYLPRNTRPVVTAITAHPPGVVFQRPFVNEEGAIFGLDDRVADARRPQGDTPPQPPQPGRRMFQKGLQTLMWRAEDGDSDRLAYRLDYRRDGDTDWRLLRDGLEDPVYVWDTTGTPDGRYVVRVVASDAATHPSDRALAGDRTSEPITIDNTPPVVTVETTGSGANVRLTVRAVDAISPILRLEYSVGGEPWRLVYPVDGLADSPDERFEIPIANAAEAGRVVVRATDALQNAASRTAGGG
jgi:hypothetical protein